MIIVALESSGLVASAAIMQDDRLVAEYTMNNKKTHSQTLLPMLDEIVRSAELDKNDIDAIAISAGPGSFTGLRIGSATAKGLGLALDKPLVEVSTLAGLAYNLYGTRDAVICPIMDAKRGEVYSGIYEFTPADPDCFGTGAEAPAVFTPLNEESAGPLTDVIDQLNKLGSHVIFIGDAVPVYPDVIRERIKVPYSFAPAHLSRQRAGAVAALAMEYLKQGRTVSAADHAPTYLRMSQAEREKARRESEA